MKIEIKNNEEATITIGEGLLIYLSGKYFGTEISMDTIQQILDNKFEEGLFLLTKGPHMGQIPNFDVKFNPPTYTFHLSPHSDSITLFGSIPTESGETIAVVQYVLYNYFDNALSKLEDYKAEIVYDDFFKPNEIKLIEILNKHNVQLPFLRSSAMIVKTSSSIKDTLWAVPELVIDTLSLLINYDNLFKQFDVTAEQFITFVNKKQKLKKLLKNPEYGEKITVITAHLARDG